MKENEDDKEIGSNPASELTQTLNSFLIQLDALFEAQDRVMSLLWANEKEAVASLGKVVETLKSSRVADGKFRLTSDSDEWENIKKVIKFSRKATEARRLISHSFLVSMVSQYDAFFSSAVRKLFLLRPEKIRSGDRSISIKDLVRYSTIDEALMELVNDEVDEVLRGSHLDQLEWLSKKFGFTIDAKLDIVQRFIEIAERRNICVHSDGRVSKYYVDCCKKLDSKFVTKKKIGEWVPIGSKYLRMSRNVLFEVGLRAIQTAWRKARPDQGKEQAGMLIDITFELLNLEDYDLAKNIGDFTLELRDISDVHRKSLVVNAAIAYKLGGDSHKAMEILDKVDWSASESKFKLAVAVLRGDFERASYLMEAVPKEGDGAISASHYRSWPLFIDARNDEEFKNAFQRKFGEPLAAQFVEVPSDANELINDPFIQGRTDDIEELSFDAVASTPNQSASLTLETSTENLLINENPSDGSVN